MTSVYSQLQCARSCKSKATVVIILTTLLINNIVFVACRRKRALYYSKLCVTLVIATVLWVVSDEMQHCFLTVQQRIVVLMHGVVVDY